MYQGKYWSGISRGDEKPPGDKRFSRGYHFLGASPDKEVMERVWEQAMGQLRKIVSQGKCFCQRSYTTGPENDLSIYEYRVSQKWEKVFMSFLTSQFKKPKLSISYKSIEMHFLFGTKVMNDFWKWGGGGFRGFSKILYVKSH